MLRRRSRGEGVKLLQQALVERGYPLVVDGEFGFKTERAVMQFQAAHGLQVDGRVGVVTWAELRKPVGEGATLKLEARKKRLQDLVLHSGLGERRSVTRRSRVVPVAESEHWRRKVLVTAIDQLGLMETDREGHPSGSNGGSQIAHIVDEGGDGFSPSAYYTYHQVPDAAERPMPPWCFVGDVELLTEYGWVPFCEVRGRGGRVAQVDPERLTVELVEPVEYVEKEYAGRLARIRRRGVDLTMDEGHRLYGKWRRPSRKALARSWPEHELYAVRDLADGDATCVVVPGVKGTTEAGVDLSDLDLKLLGLFLADGFYHRDMLEVSVSRPYKIEFCRGLDPVSEYTAPRAYGRSNVPMTQFQWEVPEFFSWALVDYKKLDPAFIWGLSSSQCALLLDTIQRLDGCLTRGKHRQIGQSRADLVDDLQILAVLAGYGSQIRDDGRIGEFGSRKFTLSYEMRGLPTHIKRSHVTTWYPESPVSLYCVQVPSGLIVVRSPGGGRAMVVGNCAIFACWAIREGMGVSSWEELPFGTWQGWVYGIESWGWDNQKLIHSSQIGGTDPQHLLGGVFVMSRQGSASDVDKTTKAGHCGLVVGMTEAGSLITIDGNVGNAVREMERPVSSVVGVVQWW